MRQLPTRCSFWCSVEPRIANFPSHAEPGGPEDREELESRPVGKGHGATGNDTDPAPEEEEGELKSKIKCRSRSPAVIG